MMLLHLFASQCINVARRWMRCRAVWGLISVSLSSDLSYISSSRSSERGGGQGDLQQQRQPSGPAEKAPEGPDGLHGPPAGAAGAQLRAAEVSERPGPHGAGRLPQPHRHAGQDLVPEPEVMTPTVPLWRWREVGEGGLIWFLTARSSLRTQGRHVSCAPSPWSWHYSWFDCTWVTATRSASRRPIILIID